MGSARKEKNGFGETGKLAAPPKRVRDLRRLRRPDTGRVLGVSEGDTETSGALKPH
jgi:hypothetical protein